MAGLNYTTNGFRIMNGLAPQLGPIGMQISADFSAITQYDFDLVKEMDNNDIDIVQSVFVDNSNGNHPVYFQTDGGISVPVYCNTGCQGIFPVFSSGSLKGKLGAKQALAGGFTTFVFLNVPMPFYSQAVGV